MCDRDVRCERHKHVEDSALAGAHPAHDVPSTGAGGDRSSDKDYGNAPHVMAANAAECYRQNARSLRTAHFSFFCSQSLLRAIILKLQEIHLNYIKKYREGYVMVFFFEKYKILLYDPDKFRVNCDFCVHNLYLNILLIIKIKLV